jgi:ElaB/YqjD/DUF883 family membrane-anchored ribosome-binding protein
MSSRDPITSAGSSSVDPLLPPDEQGSTKGTGDFEDRLDEPVNWSSSEYLEGVQQQAGGEDESPTGATSGAQEKAGEMADKAQEMTQTVQEKATEVGQMAQGKADAGMDAAATGLGQAASMLRQQGEQYEGTVGTAADRAAGTLESASSYLQNKDTSQIVDDIEAFVRQRPVESVLIAAGIGFVLSKMVK